MIRKIIRKLPPGFIGFLGQLQFRIPILGRVIRRMGEKFAAQEGVIERGVGAGLKFNATGGYPGYLLGTSEPDEQAMMAKFLSEGKVFYDIGANIGFYVVLGSRLVGESGHVYAFEPFPTSVEAIRHNLNINGFTHATVVAAAVAKGAGTMRLSLGDNSAKHRLSAEGSGGDGIDVEVVGIDEYRAATGARPPDLVMIDVEGAEVAVLQGMVGTIRDFRPVILCEVHWIVEPIYEFFESVLKPLNYTFKTLGDIAAPKSGETPIRYQAIWAPEPIGAAKD